MKHGTRRAYDGGCRCDPCRAFQSAKSARYRARKQAAAALEPTVIPHGTSTGYTVYACRCALCRTAPRSRSTPEVRRRANVRWAAAHPDLASEVPQQSATLERATKRFQRWTGAETEMLVVRRDLSDEELALGLGRTLYAIREARRRATTDPKWIRIVGA